MKVTDVPHKGQSGFIKEYLFDNPRSNSSVINQAWKDSGMEGEISAGLINKIRSEMGLAGNLKKRKTPKKSIRIVSRKTTTRLPSERTIPSRLESLKPIRGLQDKMVQLEAELDRLIYKVKDKVKLAKVEDGLLEARRMLSREIK